MKKLLLSSILIAVLLATNLAWADLPPSTSLKAEVLQTTYSYKASNGTTVVLGEVQNDDPKTSISKVSVYVKFMRDDGTVVESKTGTTLLQVIPPKGKSPFSVASTNPDPSISTVQVNMGPFNSSTDKPQMLTITTGSLQVSDNVVLSGSISNNGAQQSLNTKVYLILYDAFQRVIRVGVSSPVDVGSGKSSQFNIVSDFDPRVISYALVAESDAYQSKVVQKNLQVMPVQIGNSEVTDVNGTSYSTVPVNATVKITSNLGHIVNSSQPFVYYVQIKQFDGQSEFIGKSDGVFLGLENQDASVEWTPHVAGSYFIETYVWDYDMVPLAESEAKITIMLVK